SDRRRDECDHERNRHCNPAHDKLHIFNSGICTTVCPIVRYWDGADMEIRSPKSAYDPRGDRINRMSAFDAKWTLRQFGPFGVFLKPPTMSRTKGLGGVGGLDASFFLSGARACLPTQVQGHRSQLMVAALWVSRRPSTSVNFAKYWSSLLLRYWLS